MVPKYQLIIALCFIGGSLNKKVQKVGKIEPLYLLQEYQQSIFTELFENIWLEISPSFFVPLSECPFAIAKTHSSVLCDIMLSSMLTPSWLIFIGPESDHWLCLSLTHSITHSVTFSKLYWCDPGAWRCQLKTYWVDKSLLQIWSMRIGHTAKLLFRLWAQSLVKILSLSLVEIVMLGWDFEVNA